MPSFEKSGVVNSNSDELNMKWIMGIIIVDIIAIFLVFLKRKQDEVEASFQNAIAWKVKELERWIEEMNVLLRNTA